MTQFFHDCVYEFHEAFGLTIHKINDVNIFNDTKMVSLRIKLIEEEFNEFCMAFETNNLIEIIDAMADILYVVYGACISFGITLPTFPQKLKQLNTPTHMEQFKNNKFYCEQYINSMKIFINDLKISLNRHNCRDIHTSLYCMVNSTLSLSMTSLCIDIIQAFDIVHKSNMTKLCSSNAEAIESVTWYKINEIHRYTTPSFRKSDNNKYWVIYDKTTGKILKNVHYTLPNLLTLIKS